MEIVLIIGVGLIEIIALLNRGGGPLVSHLFLTGITAIAVAAWIYFVSQGKYRLNASKKLIAAYIAYGIFYSAFLISFAFSKTPEYGLSEILLFGNAGILFIIFTQIKFEKINILRLKILIVGLAAAEILWGIFLYINHPFPRFAGSFLDLGQPYTSFANDFANFLIIPIFISVGFLIKKYARVTTGVLITTITSLLLTGFILSFSRAAWLGVLATMILITLWIWIFRKKILSADQFESSKIILLRIICILGIATILVAGLQAARQSNLLEVTPVLKKLTFTADEGAASISERLFFWKGAAQLIKEEPLFGAGVQSFKYTFPKYQAVFGITWDHPHNLILKMGVENGLIAALAFVAFLAIVVLSSLIFYIKNPVSSVVFFIFASIAATAHNLLDYNFIVSNFVLLIIALSIPFSFVKTSFVIRKKSSLIFISVILLISTLLTGVALYDGYYNYHFKKGRAELEAKNYDLAVNHLEKSNKLIFPRDNINFLAMAYQKKFAESGNINWRIKEKHLLENLFNSIDATVWSRLAEIYEEEGNLSASYQTALRAIKLDGQNKLKYYYQVLKIAKSSPSFATNQAVIIEETVKNILQEYTDALKSNRHNTVISDNPTYAFLLYELFGENEKREEIYNIWLDEYLKFIIKYGEPTENIIY